MIKNVIKEIIITLLLALAIILILGVILYEYVPTNKVVPEKISYTTPETVQEELQKDELVDETELVVTYQIDSTDLNNYQRIREYVPGRKNPFKVVDKEEEQTEGSDGTVTETTSNGNSTSSSTGYLPDKGTK